VEGPRGVTGIASVLRHASTGAGSGVHVQISKNWHTKEGWESVPYSQTWYSPVVLLRLPPESQLVAELLLVYQFFGAFHSVSHAQLSLVGWGMNGLWEEVGLGSAGEAICYEAGGQPARMPALFLGCRDTGCGHGMLPLSRASVSRGRSTDAPPIFP
jgi:hypothetical protein